MQPPRTFSWTDPKEIDGEPEEVAALVVQQLSELAAIVGEVSLESFKMLRSVGLGRELSRPGPSAAFGQLAAWTVSDEGHAVEHFRSTAVAFVTGVDRLVKESGSGMFHGEL